MALPFKTTDHRRRKKRAALARWLAVPENHEKVKAYNRAYQKRRRREDLGYAEFLRAYARENRTVTKSYAKRKYGISLERYDALKATFRSCMICGKDADSHKGGALHIDHDHLTGELRGMLCGTCNTGLGSFQDSPALLQKAIAYLGGDHASL